MITNGYLFYALPFLELYPEYECPSTIPDCKHQDRCLNRDGISVNWSSHKSLDNWVERFNIEITPLPYMIDLISNVSY